jgi:hypothetical protein
MGGYAHHMLTEPPMSYSRKDAIAKVKELHGYTQREIRDIIRIEFPTISEKGLRAVMNAALYGSNTLIDAFINDKIAVTEAIVLARIPDVQIQDLAVQSLVELGPEDPES